MIKALILDDDATASRIIDHLLQKFFSESIIVVSICSTLEDALRDIHEYNPDLLFLDIYLDEDKTSFDLLKNFNTDQLDLIFITSYKDYAIKAIGYNATHYLLKPVDPISFMSAVKRYINKRSRTENYEKMKILFENLEVGAMQSEKVAFPISTGFKLVNISSIKYCEADINYCIIYLNNGQKLLVSKTLKHVEQMLPSHSFVRIHKSFLVNKHFVVEYNRADGGYLYLADGVKLPVSNRKKNIINQFF